MSCGSSINNFIILKICISKPQITEVSFRFANLNAKGQSGSSMVGLGPLADECRSYVIKISWEAGRCEAASEIVPQIVIVQAQSRRELMGRAVLMLLLPPNDFGVVSEVFQNENGAVQASSTHLTTI